MPRGLDFRSTFVRIVARVNDVTYLDCPINSHSPHHFADSVPREPQVVPTTQYCERGSCDGLLRNRRSSPEKSTTVCSCIPWPRSDTLREYFYASDLMGLSRSPTSRLRLVAARLWNVCTDPYSTDTPTSLSPLRWRSERPGVITTICRARMAVSWNVSEPVHVMAGPRS